MTRRPALDRRALFGMGAAAALLAVSGVSAAGMARRGGRLRLAVSGGRRDDIWATGGGLFMQLARVGLVHDTLTEVAADGTLRGDLAQGWRSADNGQTWRFDLRQDVAFHDGHLMTAEDVADSLRRGLGEPDTVKALGKSGVEITLSRPDAGLPFRLAGPGFAIGRPGADAAGIGTGPYRLVEF
ncbi:ABC transporter substrate-binding protein, partial [Sulfitobacter sp. HI0129]